MAAMLIRSRRQNQARCRPLAFVAPAIALAIHVGTALMWLIPDRRIEDEVKS